MGRRRLDRRLGEQSGQLDAGQSLGAQLGDAGHLEGFQRGAGGALQQQVRQFGIAGQSGPVHVGGDDRTLDRAVVGDTVRLTALRRAVADARDDAAEGAASGPRTVPPP